MYSFPLKHLVVVVVGGGGFLGGLFVYSVDPVTQLLLMVGPTTLVVFTLPLRNIVGNTKSSMISVSEGFSKYLSILFQDLTGKRSSLLSH